MKEFMIAFLVAALGITKTEAEEKVNAVENDPEAQRDLFDLHKAKVAELKKTELDNGYKKGTKEVKFAFENDLKEKFGITSDKKGIELVEELVEARTKAANTPEAISEDAVKKHPVFLALEARAKTEKVELEKEFNGKLNQLEKAQAKKETLKTVSEIAISEFDKLNPVLSADPVKAAKQKAQIIKAIEAGDYQIEGKDVLLLDESGKRREDEHGNPLKLSDHVRGIADDLGFDFKVAEERSSAAAGSNPGGNQQQQNQDKKFSGKLPANENEYNQILFDPALTAEQKTEVQAYWSEQQAK